MLFQNIRTAEAELILLTLWAKPKTDNPAGANIKEIRRALDTEASSLGVIPRSCTIWRKSCVRQSDTGTRLRSLVRVVRNGYPVLGFRAKRGA